ncbi:MAG: dihydrodipicolinate synthase family protein [Rhodospirillales bacterium 69-11]|nr:dihydrodipicolinate synthase family protein [Rhodospirillales bacterium]OJW28112.1 MAG: dihydrodipicolinate synthase family protein [Rhodospirillales bacterium 69-11]
MRLTPDATGVYVIAPTPFRDDGALALDDIPRMVDFFLARGIQGLTVLGMMGEATKLTEAEALQVAHTVLRAVGGQVPVVFGVPSSGFAAMQMLARAVMDSGAAGVMVAPPATLRGDAAVLRHYATVAELLGDTPFVLQDYPQGTGVTMGSEVIRRIIDTLPTCAMLKHEDWPGLDKLSWLRAAEAEGMRRVPILTGNGGLFLPDELRRGADGAMTGFAFPEMMRDVIAAHRAGDAERAADVFDAYLPLVRYEQQPGLGLAVRKHVLTKRGALSCAAQRRPAAPLSRETIADVEFLLARLERRLAALG